MLALGLAGTVIIVAACTGRLLAIGLINAGVLLADIARDARSGAVARHRKPVPASTPASAVQLVRDRHAAPALARRTLQVRSAA